MYSVVMMMVLSQAPDVATWRGHGCRGCYGGCYGCHGCGGCWGGCYGCGGCYGGCYGCYGCGGCWGGCWSYGCGGCWGGCYGCYGYACYGCYGGSGHAMAYYGGGAYAMSTPTSTAATVVVNLPADAKLSFDGAPTSSTSNVRRFNTPALGAGDFAYVVSAEIVRDGKTLSASQTITVRAGQTTEVQLPDSAFTTSVAMK